MAFSRDATEASYYDYDYSYPAYLQKGTCKKTHEMGPFKYKLKTVKIKIVKTRRKKYASNRSQSLYLTNFMEVKAKLNKLHDSYCLHSLSKDKLFTHIIHPYQRKNAGPFGWSTITDCTELWLSKECGPHPALTPQVTGGQPKMVKPTCELYWKWQVFQSPILVFYITICCLYCQC